MIHYFPRPIGEDHIKGTLSELNTGDPIFYKKHHLDGRVETKYHKNLVDILDRVFRLQGMKFLSRKQELFFKKFFEAANIINQHIENKDDNIYSDVFEEFMNLDHFLGSQGVDHVTKHTPPR